MLNIEILRQVRTIVVHQNSPGNPCPDGTAAALLLHDVLPEAKIHFATHGHASLESLPVEEGMLFCDITPPVDKAAGFVAAGAIVLDHHEKQKDVVSLFGGRGVYAEGKGISGASLAFTQVWSVFKSTVNYEFEQASTFARLASIRDSWWKDHKYWELACEQAEALRFWPWESYPESPFYMNNDLDGMLSVGKVLVQKKKVRDLETAANARHFRTRKSTRIAIVPTTETSDVSDLVDADVLIGFKYSQEASSGKLRLILSMRSRRAYDVGALAVALGGGGHKFAAGAQVEILNVNPYRRIMDIFDEYEATL